MRSPFYKKHNWIKLHNKRTQQNEACMEKQYKWSKEYQNNDKREQPCSRKGCMYMDVQKNPQLNRVNITLHISIWVKASIFSVLTRHPKNYDHLYQNKFSIKEGLHIQWSNSNALGRNTALHSLQCLYYLNTNSVNNNVTP